MSSLVQILVVPKDHSILFGRIKFLQLSEFGFTHVIWKITAKTLVFFRKFNVTYRLLLQYFPYIKVNAKRF